MSIKKIILICVIPLMLFIGCGDKTDSTTNEIDIVDKYPDLSKKTVIMKDGKKFTLYYDKDVWDVNVIKKLKIEETP